MLPVGIATAVLTFSNGRQIQMTTINLTIEKADAEKIAEALNHVYREIFDKERAGEPLRALAQQISDKAQLGRRF